MPLFNLVLLGGGFDPASWAILITAVSTGVGTIIASFANRKAIDNASHRASQSAQNVADKLTENQKTVASTFQESQERTHTQISNLSAITDKIEQLANGNLHDITQSLADANEKISELKSQYNQEIVAELQKQKDAFRNLHDLINDVRYRQHELANFLNEVGIEYQLRPLKSSPPNDSPDDPVSL
jgi:hypothetical protein